MTPEIRAGLARARLGKRSVVLATRLPDGLQYLLPDRLAREALNVAAEALLRSDRSRIVAWEQERWFLRPYSPPLRLMVVGAVHIAQALVQLARPLGLDPIIIDPRSALATVDRFPATRLVAEWPDLAMPELEPDPRSAVIALTHDPKIDDVALDLALRSEAFYIGALGSRKSHAARRERLAALGHGEADLARIRGPIGLAIGAVTAPEIALSILGELVAVLRGVPLGKPD
jgi:xanthine dehydrogenase accessory factor